MTRHRRCPLEVDELTAEWFSARVRTRRRARRGARPALGHDRARAHRALGRAGVPATVFVKLPPFDEAQRVFVNDGRDGRHRGALLPRPRRRGAACASRRRWFADVLRRRPLRDGARRPRGRAAAASRRPNDDDIEFRARDIVEQLAALHARYWESPRFDDGGDLAWLAPKATGRRRRRREVRADGRRRLRRPARPTASYRSPSSTSHARATSCGCTARDRARSCTATRTWATCSSTATRTGFLDWAVIGRAPGLRDVAYVLCNSIPTEVRARRTSATSIERYCALLGADGRRPRLRRRVGAVPAVRRLLVGLGHVHRRHGLEVAAGAHRARRHDARDGRVRSTSTCVGLLETRLGSVDVVCRPGVSARFAKEPPMSVYDTPISYARRRARRARRPEGQRHAARERRVVLRAHAAVRRARERCTEVRRPGLLGHRHPVQPVRRAGAGHARRDRDVLQHQLRRARSRSPRRSR